MRSKILVPYSLALLLLRPAGAQAATETDPVKTLVARLDFERYKATIRGLTKFGDRRQGTDRNRTALVMEIARVLSAPDVITDRSIRLALWNNEETGLNGARAYVDQRKDLQGKEDPPGSGKYPEPKWLGMIQHDMMLFDHGMPRKDGTVSDRQRPEADVNIEFQSTSKFAAQAATLA